MSLNTKLVAFSQAVGVDVGELIMTRGVMANLTTVQKGNLVAAINELKMGLASVDLTVIINDNADVGVLDQVWSADKITMRLNQLKVDVLNGAPDSMNTLKEISDYLASNDQNINSLLTNLGGTVRYDASQDLLVGQQLQACVNIDVGDPEVDLVGYYASQKPIITPVMALGGNYNTFAGPKSSVSLHIDADNSSLSFDLNPVIDVTAASVPASAGYLGSAAHINSITDLKLTILNTDIDVRVSNISILSGAPGQYFGTLSDAYVASDILVPNLPYNFQVDYSAADRRVSITLNVTSQGNSSNYTFELDITGV